MDDAPDRHEREARVRALTSLPLNALLGIEYGEREATRARLRLHPSREAEQPDGVVHGGVLATLADSAAVWAILPDLAAGRTITSIDFRLDFVRAALSGRGVVEAEAEVVKVGRRVARAEVTLSQEERLVARATCVYSVIERAAARP